MNYELSTDNGKTWAKAETRNELGCDWVRVPGVGWCTVNTSGALHITELMPQYRVRPLSPRPSIGGVEIGEGWITALDGIPYLWRGGKVHSWARPRGPWQASTVQELLGRERLATPADFAPGQPGESIPLSDIPEEQAGVRLREEVRKLREGKPFAVGDRVETLDERTIGTVTEVHDGECLVTFASPIFPTSLIRFSLLRKLPSEAKEKPDHSRVTIAGREARVYTYHHAHKDVCFRVEIGGLNLFVEPDSRVYPRNTACAEEPMTRPAGKPLPASAVAKIAAMLQPGEKAVEVVTYQPRFEAAKSWEVGNFPQIDFGNQTAAVDWKAHADLARKLTDVARDYDTRDLAATVAALCDAMAGKETR